MTAPLPNARRRPLFCFVCLGFFVPPGNFSLLWRRHHCRWRAANFELCPALVAIEQWGFFNVPNLLWHRPLLYNGHLRGPMTLTPVVERLAVELSVVEFHCIYFFPYMWELSPICYTNTCQHHTTIFSISKLKDHKNVCNCFYATFVV